MNDPHEKKPEDAFQRALRKARRQERLSEAAWRQKRAEVARMVAAGEAAAARRLLRSVGVDLPGAEPTIEPTIADTTPTPPPQS